MATKTSKDKNHVSGQSHAAGANEPESGGPDAAPAKEKRVRESAPLPEGQVNVKMLAQQFNMEETKVRQVIRGIGVRAPEVDNQGQFGPRSRYQWAEGSEELGKIREALKNPAPASKKKENAEQAPTTPAPETAANPAPPVAATETPTAPAQ